MKFKDLLDKILPKEVKEIFELIEDMKDTAGIDLIPDELKPITRLYNPNYKIQHMQISEEEMRERGEPKMQIESIEDFIAMSSFEDEDVKMGDDGVIRQPMPRLPSFVEEILKRPEGVHLVLGSIGTGKTALSLRLAELMSDYTGKPVYVMNMPVYPSWVKGEVQDVRQVPPNSILIIDDASQMFDSWQRNKQSKWLSDLMFIARHKGVAIIVNTQESSTLLRRILGQAKSIWIKPPSLMFEETERGRVAKLIEKAMNRFMEIPPEERKKYVYVVTHDGEALIKVRLPSGWSEEISKNKAFFNFFDEQPEL